MLFLECAPPLPAPPAPTPARPTPPHPPTRPPASTPRTRSPASAPAPATAAKGVFYTHRGWYLLVACDVYLWVLFPPETCRLASEMWRSLHVPGRHLCVVLSGDFVFCTFFLAPRPEVHETPTVGVVCVYRFDAFSAGDMPPWLRPKCGVLCMCLGAIFALCFLVISFSALF